MASLDTRIIDVQLYKLISDASDVCLCSANPGLDWSAFEAAEVARKVGPVWGLIESDGGTGRRVAVLPFVDGVWTEDGTATHIALVDRNSEIVLLSRPLTSSVVGVAGQVFSTSANWTITQPGPA